MLCVFCSTTPGREAMYSLNGYSCCISCFNKNGFKITPDSLLVSGQVIQSINILTTEIKRLKEKINKLEKRHKRKRNKNVYVSTV